METSTSKYQNHFVVGICILLVGIAMAMVQYKVPTIMLSIMDQFDMSMTSASWLMSIFVVMMIPLAIPIGALTVKIGPRKIILLSVVIMVAGCLLGAFAPATELLMVSRALEGVAVTALTVCAPVLIGQCVAPERVGTALGFWGVWGPLGSAAAALLTPTIYATTGFKGLWIAYAAIVVVAAIIMFIAVKEPVLPSHDVDGRQLPNVSYRQLITRDTILFFIGFIGFNVVLLAVLSYVPTILQSKGMDPTMSGFVSTLPMLLAVISSPVFGAISDKIEKTKPLLVLTIFFLGPCACLLYNTTGMPIWIAAIVMGLVGMGSSGLVINGFMKVLPDPRLASVGMGVLITIQGLGQFIGSALVQVLLGPSLDRLLFAGLVVMFIALAGTACIALAHFNE